MVIICAWLLYLIVRGTAGKSPQKHHSTLIREVGETSDNLEIKGHGFPEVEMESCGLVWPAETVLSTTIVQL